MLKRPFHGSAWSGSQSPKNGHSQTDQSKILKQIRPSTDLRPMRRNAFATLAPSPTISRVDAHQVPYPNATPFAMICHRRRSLYRYIDDI